MKTVSVVIPTVGRTSLRAAVESVLRQKHCIPEAIVVLDAPQHHAKVRAMLADLPHSLLTTDHEGAATARNVGLSSATSEFLGYLDDDDEWEPTKATKQIMAIERSSNPERTIAVALSSFVRRDGKRATSRPELPPADPKLFPAYLVSRKRIRYGGVFFNTPSLLGQTPLMQQFTWDSRLRKHQDWDLLIRIFSEAEISWTVVEEPLVNVNQGSPGSISSLAEWLDGANWLEKHDTVLVGAGRADFVLLHILLHAIRQRSSKGINYSIRKLGRNLPHPAAVGRFAAGLVIGR